MGRTKSGRTQAELVLCKQDGYPSTLPRHRKNHKLGAELGRRIYDEQYREKFEPQHKGKVLAIDIESGLAGFGENSSEAMAAEKKAAPGGFFYMVRIGFPTTFDLH